MTDQRRASEDCCDTVLVYATFPGEPEALAAGRQLVEARLAGCINVLPGMTSVYVWQGNTQTAREAVLIAKTRRDLSDAVIAFIRAHHPYELPAILTLPVIAGNPDYLAWLRAGTDGATS